LQEDCKTRRPSQNTIARFLDENAQGHVAIVGAEVRFESESDATKFRAALSHHIVAHKPAPLPKSARDKHSARLRCAQPGDMEEINAAVLACQVELTIEFNRNGTRTITLNSCAELQSILAMISRQVVVEEVSRKIRDKR
jgi:hypothetical protein